MKKILKNIAAGCAMMMTILAAAVMPAAAEAAQTYTDDLGREVTLEKEPERVASLLGSFASAWTLAGGELVASTDDAWEDFDLDLSEDCINIGNLQELSLELLLSAEPDLVIASAKSQQDVEWMETLEDIGIPVLYFDVFGFEDYLHMLDVFTQITGREDLYEENGLKVQEKINDVVNKSLEVLKGNEGPEILLIRAAKTSVKAKGSEGTVLGEILQDLGCVNIADGSDLLENLTMEAIIAADPEYVFVVFMGDDSEAAQANLDETLMNNPAWAGLTAVKEGHVYYMDKHLYNFKPNQLWGEAYQQAAEILYGDIFE